MVWCPACEGACVLEHCFGLDFVVVCIIPLKYRRAMVLFHWCSEELWCVIDYFHGIEHEMRPR